MRDFEEKNQWKAAWSLFESLIDVPISTAFKQLDGNEEVSDEVKNRVRKLLANLQQRNTSFDYLAEEFLSQSITEIVDFSGQIIGPYHLIELVGSGGMSSVYQALRTDTDIQKKVAIKMMHPFSVSKSSMRMFDREQRALAQLNHPNIISFHHGGCTKDGTPFLVTDFVEKAEVISDYVIKNQLPQRTVIKLFLSVLDAIHCAHTNLIIHKDIKPGNILVDMNGQPKVVDFGIASLDTDKKESTTMVFTPEYAAPEQLQGGFVTTQTDVFALGGVLLSLLTYEKPLPEFKQRTSEISGDEKHVRRVLQNSVLGSDLCNIILQAMQSNPDDRYATVTDFRQDLSNWLDNKPVMATKDSLLYRLRKFVKRKRAVSILFVVILLSLGVGFATTIHQKNIADHEARKANEVKRFLLDALASSDPDVSAGRNLNVRDLLLEARANLSQREFQSQALQAELHQTIGISLGKIGEYEMAILQLEQAKNLTENQSLIEMSIIELLFESKQYDSALTRMKALTSGEKKASLDSYQMIGLKVKEMNYLGTYDAAEKYILDQLEHVGVEKNSAQRMELNLLLASTFVNNNKQQKAEDLLIKTLDLSRQLYGNVNTKTIDVLQVLARFYEDSSENGIAKSLGYLEEVLRLQNQLYQSTHPKLITTHIRLANNHKALGQNTEAKALAQKAKDMAIQLYGEHNIFAARADVALSHLALMSGNMNEAIVLLQDAVDVYESHYGSDHFETNQYKTSLASYLLKVGDAERSLELLNQLYQHQLEQLGPLHMATLYVQLNQIKALTMLKRLAQAIDLGEATLIISRKELGEDQVITVGVILALGVAYFESHDHQSAFDYLSMGEEAIIVRSNPTYHKGLLKQLITSSIETGKLGQAESYYQKLAALYAESSEPLNDEEKLAFMKLEKMIGSSRN